MFSVNAASVPHNTGDMKPCGRNPQGSSTPMTVPTAGSSTTPSTTLSSTSATPPPT
ncbi:unnamed protein product [Nezara viridula]|uniref:Uncharacterized protein n=1 Tax=Nezara viridula TaxID=85310 RepID=A0A9P0MY63_NEZVI|nr:unnamed protein product [Nezara viridula]